MNQCYAWMLAVFAVVVGAGCAAPAAPPVTAPAVQPSAAMDGRNGPAPDAAGATAAAAAAAEALNREALAATPEQAYRSARGYLAQGRPEQARAVLAARVVNPRSLRGAAAEQNARLLALLGELAAAERPASAASLSRAETYLAWAIAGDPCMGEYWHLYMRVRVARAGYAGVLSQLEHREPVRYSADAIGFSHTSISVPWADSWLYLRGLLYAETDDRQRAVDNLVAFKQASNACPVDQTLGELYHLLGRDQDAVVYLTPASDSVPGRRSPMRYYMLGVAKRAMGDTAGARRDLLESSRLDPTLDAPRNELMAMDWELTGDREIQNTLFHRALTEHPNDLDAWITFWQVRFRSGTAPQQEFRSFAAAIGDANQNLSQPAVAQAISLLWDGQGDEAARLLAGVADSPGGGDLCLARLLVAVSRLDGPGARQALDRLATLDSDLHQTLLRLGLVPLISLFGAADAAGAAKAERAAELLFAAAREPGTARIAGPVAQAYVHSSQGTPEGVRTTIDAMVTDHVVLGRSVLEIEQRVVLHEAEIRSLNQGAVRLLARVTSLKEEQIRQSSELVLQDSQIKQLALQQQQLADRVAAEIQSSEQRLTAMLRSQNRRVQAALDQLGREVASHQDKLAELERAAGDSRDKIEQEGKQLAALEQWRKMPQAQVPGEVSKFSSLLRRLSAYGVSIGPSLSATGFNFSISCNLISTLSEVLDAMAG